MDIYQVDAFTDRPFFGNPAAICPLDGPVDDNWMQSLANEMNLSETAFLEPRGQNRYGLRWFTPRVEVDLCGHATLASAHLLWETGRVAANQVIEFETRSGTLKATLDGPLITLDFPATPPESAEAPAGLLQALGMTQALAVARSRFDYLVQTDSPETLAGLQPDMGALAQVEARGVIVTCAGDGQPFDFESRFFAPACGVPEDPVTGSAHCCLAPFWSEQLNGKERLHALQASHRPGEVHLRLQGDRVMLSGKAVTVFSGRLTNPAQTPLLV